MNRKDERTPQFGRIIALPTCDYKGEGRQIQALNQFKKLAGKNPQNPREIFVSPEDLKAISDHHERAGLGPLVHVFAANTTTAALSPYDFGKEKPGTGQAGAYQGWEIGHREREAVGGKLWLYVAGIPTCTRDGTRLNDDQLKPYIQHYIAQLYFYIAQGKSICIPVREKDWQGKHQHDNSEYSIEEESAPARTRISEIIEIPTPLMARNTQVYEYAFGGASEKKFVSSPNFAFLEKELNQLNFVAELLHRGLKNEDSIIEEIPGYARWAFKEGLKSNAMQLDHTKYKASAAPKPLTDEHTRRASEDLRNKDKPASTVKSKETYLGKIDKKEFSEFLKLKKHTFSTAEKSAKIFVDGKTDQEIILQRADDNHLEVTTTKPNARNLQVMTEVLKKVLGEKAEVTIEITGTGTKENIEKAKDALWLEAIKAGLRVTNHTPENPAILLQAKQFLSSQPSREPEQEENPPRPSRTS